MEARLALCCALLLALATSTQAASENPCLRIFDALESKLQTLKSNLEISRGMLIDLPSILGTIQTTTEAYINDSTVETLGRIDLDLDVEVGSGSGSGEGSGYDDDEGDDEEGGVIDTTTTTTTTELPSDVFTIGIDIDEEGAETTTTATTVRTTTIPITTITDGSGSGYFSHFYDDESYYNSYSDHSYSGSGDESPSEVVSPTQATISVVEPEVTVAEPEPTVVEPEVIVAEPELTGVEAEVTVAVPELSVVEPEVTVSEPELTVVEPEIDILEHELSVVEPEADVVESESTAVEPEPTDNPTIIEYELITESISDVDAVTDGSGYGSDTMVDAE